MELDSFEEALEGVEDIKTTYRGIFGHRNKCTAMIDECANEWKDILRFGKTIAKYQIPRCSIRAGNMYISLFFSPYNYGRIASLHSSLAAEMPVPKGVHKESHHQHFMPKQIWKRLKKFEIVNSRCIAPNLCNDNVAIRLFSVDHEKASQEAKGKLTGEVRILFHCRE